MTDTLAKLRAHLERITQEYQKIDLTDLSRDPFVVFSAIANAQAAFALWDVRDLEEECNAGHH